MTELEALQAAQFVSFKGRHFAVIGADDWGALVEWLEMVEDVSLARQALAALKAAGGNRQQAGWSAWKEV